MRTMSTMRTMSKRTSRNTSPIDQLRQTIHRDFPDYWPAVVAGLSVCATLFLEDSSNPVALIYVGGPGTGKTTVASLFTEHALCYPSNSFSPAAFVSHASNVPRAKLAEIDLLPRIQHKVLVTPELAPIFRGQEEKLVTRFAVITGVMDGRGWTTDSGTHGRRGYTGDYLFAWLGCTTPLSDAVWEVMGQLGSRLFFLRMGQKENARSADLVHEVRERSYQERVEKCRKVVHEVLDSLMQSCGGVRGMKWNRRADPKTVLEQIASLANLLAAMRSQPTEETLHRYGQPIQEAPHRAFAILHNLARGHALVHGRRQLTKDDLPLAVRVTFDSMPLEYACALKALCEEGPKGALTVDEVRAVLGVRHLETARKAMRARRAWNRAVRGRRAREASPDSLSTGVGVVRVQGPGGASGGCLGRA
jgi:hypothetical protein